MEIPTKLDTVKAGWSIVFIEGFLKKTFFLSLKTDFALVSSANPDEMPHYGLIRVFTVCRSTHLGVSKLQGVTCTRILLLKDIFAMFSYRHLFTYISKRQNDFAISRGFFIHETLHVRSFANIKLSRKFSNLQ